MTGPGLAAAMVAAAAVVCLQATTAPEPPSRTAAEPSLLERVRLKLALDDEAMLRHSYTQVRREYRVRLGKVSNGDERTYEVGPSPFEPGAQWRRLVAVNGVPLTAAQQQAHDERERRDAVARQRERAQQTPAERARRLREEQEEAARRRARLDDVARVYQFAAAGTEVIDGVPRLVFTLTPRPEAHTTSDLGKHMKKLRGRLWVDEAEAQLVRLEMDVVQDLTIGLGMIGRVDAGSRLVYARRRHGDTWLPVEARFSGHGHTLLLLPFQIDTWSIYTNYRPVEARGPAAETGSRQQPDEVP